MNRKSRTPTKLEAFPRPSGRKSRPFLEQTDSTLEISDSKNLFPRIPWDSGRPSGSAGGPSRFRNQARTRFRCREVGGRRRLPDGGKRSNFESSPRRLNREPRAAPGGFETAAGFEPFRETLPPRRVLFRIPNRFRRNLNRSFRGLNPFHPDLNRITAN